MELVVRSRPKTHPLKQGMPDFGHLESKVVVVNQSECQSNSVECHF